MKHDISKYIISSLLLVFGLVALVSYISGLMGDGLESQPHAMLLAALSLIAVGVIALPEVLDKLDAKKYKSIIIAGVVIALCLGYAVIYSISYCLGLSRCQSLHLSYAISSFIEFFISFSKSIMKASI